MGQLQFGLCCSVWEKCCVIPVEGFVNCVSTEIFLGMCSKHPTKQFGFYFVSFFFFNKNKTQKKESKTDEEKRH